MRPDGSRETNPGRFRHWVKLYEITEGAQNAAGEPTETLTLVATIRAQVEPLPGRELEAVMNKWADARYRVRCLYVSNVVTAMRLSDVCCSRTLDILDVQDEFGNRQNLVMICREVKAQ